MPDTAMIFAAGLGTRMRTLTRDRPKPLIPVAGKALIDHALDLVDNAGVSRKIVNTHYLGGMIESHLADRNDILFSPEPNHALETGGGLKAAIPLITEKAVFTLNPDVIWTGQNPLRQLAKTWSPDRMDGLLMLIPLPHATGHKGRGDFALSDTGTVARRQQDDAEAFVYSGIQIIKPGIAAEVPNDVFSLNVIWDRLIAKGTLFGLVHDGGWADVGTPEGISAAEHLLAKDPHV